MIVLKALLDRAPDKEQLFTFFTKEQERALKALPEYPFFDLSALLADKTSLDNIHYSWLKVPLSSLSTEEQEFFLSIFSPQEREKIKSLLDYQEKVRNINPLLYPFITAKLKKMIGAEGVLPPQYLPKNDLHLLLELNKIQLIQLIDLLGMYDLASELRHIVDKNTLTQIASSLTLQQRQFLSYVSKQAPTQLTERMNFKEINGDKIKLNKILHRKGLQRLGKALCQEKADFVWHFLHKIDVGRAAIISKIMEYHSEETVIKLCKRQVLSIAKRLKK